MDASGRRRGDRQHRPARDARVIIPIAVLAAALVGAPAAAQRAKYEPDWNKPVAPHRIAGNLYYVGTNELGVFLLASAAGHILIDAGFEETVPIVRDGIRALGFQYEDVRVVLSSHAHFDHAAGLARLKRETGARLAAMGADAALLEAGGKGDFRFGDTRLFPPVTVDRVLSDGDRVEHGGIAVTARHTPGHTKGAATFVTAVEENGRRLEVVVAISTTVNAGTVLLHNPRYPTLVADWEKTYRVLESLTPDIWVTGHAAAFNRDGKAARLGQEPNPFIDPAGYRDYLARGKQRFRTLLEDERGTASGQARD